MESYLISLSYDGYDYSGWVIQKNAPSIQYELNKAIFNIIKIKEFKTVAASKTDAFVHAQDQKVLLSIPFKPKKLSMFMKAINKALPDAIKINSMVEIDPKFNIRNVKYKIYEYTINNAEYNIFSQRHELFWEKQKININKLQEILNNFIGEHEFELFSGLKEHEYPEYKTKRRIEDIKVKPEKERIVISFKAKGFIRYQIRMIVGASLYCLMNKKITDQEIKEKLNGIGTKSTIVIDGKGLCLKKIEFN